jgi:hypothetical protein
MQIELPLLGLYVPAIQARHAPLEELPVKALKVPTGHAKQELRPVEGP